MTTEQIKILGALEATMQTLTDAWDDPNTTKIQLSAAYGGAAAMLQLARQTTDIDQMAFHAAILLNDAAKQLGFPELN
jgi:hypothetical protein